VRTLALIWLFVPAALAAQRRFDVTPGGAYRTVGAGVAAAQNGDTVVVHAGRYREPLVTIDKRIALVGEGTPILDGEGNHGLILVTANDVTVRDSSCAT